MTAANQAISKSESVRDLRALLGGDKMKEQLRMALPSHISVSHLLRVVFTSINKTPKLLNCTQESVMACIMDCAQLGLEPDGRNAYLIPFDDKKNNRTICTLIVGYQGLVELAYNHPKVKGIRWGVVHEKDEFRYSEGLEEELYYRPCDDEDPGRLTHAFAICSMAGGAKTFVVLNRRKIMQAKASSRSASSAYSPWSTHEEAMWAKTAVRALCKRIPRSAELVQALERDLDEAEDLPEVSKPSFNLMPNIPPAADPKPEKEEDVPMGDPAPAGPKPVFPLEALRMEMQTAGITEQQVLRWGALQRLWPARVKDLSELEQVNPERIELLLNSFAKMAADLSQPA